MNKKIIKASMAVILILTVIGSIYCLAKYTVSTKTTMSASSLQMSANNGSAGTLAAGEKNPNSYSYHTKTCEFEGNGNSTTAYKDPVYKDFQIYCIEPGSQLRYVHDISYAKALSLDGESYTRKCGTHAKTPSEGATTPPVFREVGTYTLPVAAAYIISDNPIGGWSKEKQRGIWNLRKSGLSDGLIIGNAESKQPGKNGDPQSSKYDQEAVDYTNYDNSVRNSGLNPSDKTSIESVYTKVNQDSKEYTVGPFNLTYTNGIYGNNTFSGISEMTIIGYNSKKEVVRSDIKVKKFILKDTATGIYGSAVTPEYFEPDSSIKIDTSAQVYPASGQDFQIVFDDPNAGVSANSSNRVAYISIKVKFKYMLANGQYTKLKATKYTVKYNHDDTYYPHKHAYHSGCHRREDGSKCHHIKYRSCHGCKTTCYLEASGQQYAAAMDAIRSIYEQEVEIGKQGGNGIKIATTMDLGGHVWEDGVATKETKADGVSNTQGDNIDKSLRNVKVTLYTSDGKIASLMSNPNESGITSEQIMNRVNPTYTDSEGNYLFEGLDPMKKYYVTFEYNGQIYLPTEYLNTENKQYSTVSEMVNAGLYNTNNWKITSKGTETVNDRNNYDNKFAEIGSYPENYNSSNSLGRIGSKNATFTQKDLMGYTLDENGKYKQTTTQLIDGYLYDENGNETTTYKEGVISQRIRQYIQNNRKSPDTNALKSIYSGIAGNDTEMWRKLQFIEDCKISSYTQGQGKNRDLYPVYSKFRINKKNGTSYKTAKDAQNTSYDTKSEVLSGTTYRPIYPGQFFVNQGLWRRQEFDLAMRKDVYRSVMKINNKTVMYKYDKRSSDDKYWDINVRMSDYNSYYNTSYNREVYKTDYDYSSKDLNHPGADLEIYVTYKLTIRNQSQSIMSQVKEVVDYYDKDYKYRDDLSWVTYAGDGKSNSVSDKEYYNAMVAENVSKNIKNARATNSATSSKYGASTHSDISKTYNTVYVRGLQDKKLATGESAYIYLTFQVNKQNGKVILDSESSPKMNYAEINGYSTYYRDGTTLPNNVTKNSSDIAGLIDRDSNPGNLVQSDINSGNRTEKNFEDDTDRAKAIRVIIDESAVRKANGTVWEDERTVKSGDSIVGDGIRQDNEKKIAGVTVQLVEKTIDGREYIWQETTTDTNGHYSFESYIPADYVIRFYYGNTANTTKVKGNNDYTAGGQNSVSYNGQDFKSTTYQKEITQSNYTDESNRYTGYKNTTTQNETGTYGYDIYAADSNKNNVSDAKDLWTTSNIPQITYKPNAAVTERKAIRGRQAVNSYSSSNVTNHKAEVLASPYDTPSYNGTKYTKAEMDALVNELISNTYMTAETGVIAVEFEYDRQQTDGLKATENNSSNSSKDYVSKNNRYNGTYELANIDLGLSERPKAQLELDKSISNIKVTLANGSVLFDVNKAGDNVIWKGHEAYDLNAKVAKALTGYKKLSDNSKYEDYYKDNNKNRYSYREEVDNIVKKSDKGLIQLTMDEELMHGATIEIKYNVKVTNVGETDYEGQKYYYLADSSGATVVTTVANQVVDYVANNLQFNGANAENNKWTVINNASLITSQSADNDNNLVNRRLINNVKQYNTTVQTDGLNKSLKPGESADKTIVLTQLISTENSSDDLTYSNMVEIVKTSNTVGRRMAFSVVGNQDPTLSDASEVDSSVAEKVVILPPFGNTHIFYILGAVIAVILIAGITFIIVKVNKKRE